MDWTATNDDTNEPYGTLPTHQAEAVEVLYLSEKTSIQVKLTELTQITMIQTTA
jgi:hypothetical protein